MKILVAAFGLTLLAACAVQSPAPAPVENLLVATAEGELLRVAAAQPAKVLTRVRMQGLADGEQLVGIDFRVARGVLFGLSSRGQLYTINVATGALTAVGEAVPLPAGSRFGFDFNPAADRIRLVSDTGANQRRHPDTGVLVMNDAALAYVAAQTVPTVTAAAYTYNKRDEKLTTNYALDVAGGTLLMQGSKEGAVPAVSPNSGQLTVVGELGTGAVDDAAFDISDVHNTALAALRSKGQTRLYQVNLDTGAANLIGKLGNGAAIAGIAIEP